LISKAIAIISVIYSSIFSVEVLASAPEPKAPMVVALAPLVQTDRATEEAKSPFKHGDISWLPELALAAGWKKSELKKLGHIILRESGGCPNRIGSSIVDKNCNIIGYTKATNKSDSGLLQINGVNWDMSRNRNAIACVQFKWCEQEDLLDPLNNLKVGRALFEVAGWSPWNACNWDPKRC
jgi:hypothetical protein